ncbi:MAG: hypothetical protein R2911_35920 [Caldilineaceae bacterium]
MNIQITVAEDAAAGALNETSIVVTSLYDDLVTDSRQFTTEAEAAGVSLSPAEQSGQDKPGQIISYYLTLTNRQHCRYL